MSLSQEEGYIHRKQIDFPPDPLQNGVLVTLKSVPFEVRLFKRVATLGDIDSVITNCPDETLSAQVAQDAFRRALASRRTASGLQTTDRH